MSVSNLYRFSLAIAAGVLLVACASSPRLMPSHGDLSDCSRRACVSSQSRDERHAVEPLRYAGRAHDARNTLRAAINDMSRSEIVTDGSCYMHATFRSTMTRATDDLELWFCSGPGKVDVRSARRRGLDLGANRERVEALRAALTFDPERPLHADD